MPQAIVDILLLCFELVGEIAVNGSFLLLLLLSFIHRAKSHI